ncbi:MAG: aminopeptidase P family protein [Oscillospiraceae bacterium]|nr:aminopeptidase P family protein [Oscillospiraceae bacterium]
MKNLEKFRTVLARCGADALMISSRVNRHYCTQYDIAEGLVVLSKERCVYLTDSRYIEAAETNLNDVTPVLFSADKPLPVCLKEEMDAIGAKKIALEEGVVSAGDLGRYQQLLGAEFVPCQNMLGAFRAVKEPWELELMRKAQEITDRTFTELRSVIRPGMTEKQLNAELIYRLYQFGGENVSFDPIVISGPNTSLPHGVPSERVLQKGDFITMDFGCKYGGYCSDMTRTVALGAVTDEMRLVYDTVLQAQKAGIAATRAGRTGAEIDQAARDVITDAGFGAYFGHGYGHSLGLEIHEAPNCNVAGKTVMRAGVVCSAEPGIYLPGKFGVRIEDVVIFEENGCCDITKSPKDLLIL